MELNKELKQKLTERFLKKLGKPISQAVGHVYSDLLIGKHKINITSCGKYTISEIEYYKDEYNHHFLGISARNPNDIEDRNYGIKIAVEKSLVQLITKFLLFRMRK